MHIFSSSAAYLSTAMNSYRGDAASHLGVRTDCDVAERLSVILAYQSHSCCQILRRVCLKLFNKKISF